MRLGIGTYTYMWAIGFEGAIPENPMRALDLLMKAGENSIHVVQYGPNLPLDSLSGSELDELLRNASEHRIEIEVGTKGLDVDHLRHQLEFTQRIGAQLLRTVPDYGRGPVPTESELTRTLTAVEPHCASAGVCLAIENATIPARVLEGALSRVASPWLGITLDTVNSLAVPEGTEQVVSALARHTRCLHVKDFSVDRIWHMMGFTVEGRPAGKGQLNVPWLLDQLRSAGADFNAILELWTPRQSSLAETIALEAAWADESISYLRKLIPA